jgi:hypothetical protein
VYTIHIFTHDKSGTVHDYRPSDFAEACSVARELSRDYPLGTVVLTRRDMRPRAFANGEPITA